MVTDIKTNVIVSVNKSFTEYLQVIRGKKAVWVFKPRCCFSADRHDADFDKAIVVPSVEATGSLAR